MTALSDSTHSRVSVGSRSWFRISSIWSMDAPLAHGARFMRSVEPAGVAGKPFHDTAKFSHTRRYGGLCGSRFIGDAAQSAARSIAYNGPGLPGPDLCLDAGHGGHIDHP